MTRPFDSTPRDRGWEIFEGCDIIRVKIIVKAKTDNYVWFSDWQNGVKHRTFAYTYVLYNGIRNGRFDFFYLFFDLTRFHLIATFISILTAI